MIDVENFYIGGEIANTFLMYDTESKDAVMFDLGMYFQEAFDFIEKNGLNLHALLITHAHFDHIGGLAEFDRRIHKPILIPKDDLGIFEKNGLAAFFNQPIEKPTFTGFIELPKMKFGTIELEIFKTPGHSAGSLSFLCGKHLISGDTLFKRSFGRYDLETGNFSQLKNSIKILLNLPNDVVVHPGHGPNTTILEERMYNPIDLLY